MKIGIDPGLSGALALLTWNDELIDVIDMPVMQVPFRNKVRREVAAKTLAEVLWKWATIDDNPVACIETVHAMPGQGVTSMFNFGQSYGTVLGVLAACKVPVYQVTPQEWKKEYGLIGEDKERSVLIAKAMLGGKDGWHTKQSHHGRADAILIAGMIGEKMLNKETHY